MATDVEKEDGQCAWVISLTAPGQVSITNYFHSDDRECGFSIQSWLYSRKKIKGCPKSHSALVDAKGHFVARRGRSGSILIVCKPYSQGNLSTSFYSDEVACKNKLQGVWMNLKQIKNDQKYLYRKQYFSPENQVLMNFSIDRFTESNSCKLSIVAEYI